MYTSVSCRSLLKTALALLAFALPIAGWAQTAHDLTATPADNSPNKRIHTITISYVDGAWNYTISPTQANPKKSKVKRGDKLKWVCADGKWEVFFKNGATPLVDGHDDPVFSVKGASGATDGATIGVKPHDDEAFTYGVRLKPNDGGAPVVDDPEIIIES